MRERNLDPDNHRDMAFNRMVRQQLISEEQQAAMDRDWLQCDYQAQMHEFFFGKYLGEEK